MVLEVFLSYLNREAASAKAVSQLCPVQHTNNMGNIHIIMYIQLYTFQIS